MKIKGKDLEFIYRINATGETTSVKEVPRGMENEYFDCKPLSISKETWIASNFTTYVVKVNNMPMYLSEAIKILEYYQSWRVGDEERQPKPSKITEALNIVLKEVKK